MMCSCRCVALWNAICASLILYSCSTAPVPQQGTPAFFWSAARETFAARDYMKTIDHLENVGPGSEYSKRAQAWLLVLTSGLADGFMQLAEHYEAGAMANKASPTPFRQQVAMLRRYANRMSLSFAEKFNKFQQIKDETIELDFPFPGGSATLGPTLAKISSGIMPPAPEVESIQKRALERGVLLATCRAAGAPDDPAKAQELFKKAPVQVPRAVLITAMANVLFEQAQLYAPRKLDDPEKLRIFCVAAQDALKTIPESKQTKELNSKIQAALKRAKV